MSNIFYETSFNEVINILEIQTIKPDLHTDSYQIYFKNSHRIKVDNDDHRAILTLLKKKTSVYDYKSATVGSYDMMIQES